MRAPILMPSVLTFGAALICHAPAFADGRASHVLLISIDGFHAADYVYCAASGLCPNLKALAETGVVYDNAWTSRPSDSFPGTLAQFTGGGPRTTGVYYDDTFDRTLYAAGCKADAPGVEVALTEDADKDTHSIDGGVPEALTGMNGAVALDPKKLPALKSGADCRTLWPHDYPRVNTVFGVLHAKGLRTAWSDKHPAYDVVGGPGGGVDDFFAPEINADLTPENVAKVEAAGLKSTAPAPKDYPKDADFTKTGEAAEWYDGVKAQATLNEIAGKDHLGKAKLGAPALFGMNFQAVSVVQKLKSGGYKDAAATPGESLAHAIAFVDSSIGQFLVALKAAGLSEETLVIVSAKHGQGPIDRARRVAIDEKAAIIKPLGDNYAFDVADDVALVWLKDNSGSKIADAAAALQAAEKTVDAGVGEWLFGPTLEAHFGDPQKDSRTPDLIGLARVGVIYTKGSKIAEHGGFGEDDAHVTLIVAGPGVKPSRTPTQVSTAQIAPTILEFLGLDPKALDAVRAEGTESLPGLN